MSPRTILTLANGKGVDLLCVRAEDIDFAALAEHLGKEKRFNGATPDVEYSVAQHQSIGADAILQAGGTDLEAAAFLIHDCHEALWKDDPTPKKFAIAERIAQRCGVLASDIIHVLDDIVDEQDAAIHQAARLPWPLPADVRRVVKAYDAIMFVTEWRDLMHDIPHPNWAPYAGIEPLAQRIDPLPWAHARAGWLLRANRLLPALGQRATQATPELTIEAAQARIVELDRKIASAPGWGAAVGAMDEERRELVRFVARGSLSCSPLAHGKTRKRQGGASA